MRQADLMERGLLRAPSGQGVADARKVVATSSDRSRSLRRAMSPPSSSSGASDGEDGSGEKGTDEERANIVGYGHEHITDYDTLEMSTVRLFFQCRGTVMQHKWLWIEQIMTIGICCLIAFLTDRLGLAVHVDAAKTHLSNLVEKISTLAAFLLSFYTSLAITRWWRLRTEGIGAMWSASSQLSLYLSTMVDPDQEVLSAIRRYSRASLILIFMRRRYGAAFPQHIDELVSHDVLTAEEAGNLKQWCSNLAESIWTWHAHIIARLYKQRKITSPQEYTFLMEKVNMGRSGAALIGAQMGTPVPIVYVHVIGLLVKVNNLIMAFSYGYLLGIEWHQIDTWYIVVTLGKVIFIPFLYNAILLINADLSDPFDGDVNDFPLMKYELGVESDSRSYIQAGENLPRWMDRLKQKQEV